jgi:hypothetical protein
VNPYDSLPFAVEPDGTLTCRYVMPCKEKMAITLKNFGTQPVEVSGKLLSAGHAWDDQRSQYFFARWRVDHDVISRDPGIQDLPFIIARGKGCYVGTISILLNPSNLPHSYGNWWGEGDEKGLGG